MPMILNKTQIVQAHDQVLEAVTVPEWGADAVVMVRSISAAERGRIEGDASAFRETKGRGDFARTFTVRMAALAICDERGERLFSDEDVELLRQKNALVIARISEVAQRLSGFSKEDLDLLEKNSPKAQPDASPSA